MLIFVSSVEERIIVKRIKVRDVRRKETRTREGEVTLASHNGVFNLNCFQLENAPRFLRANFLLACTSSINNIK